MTLIEKVKELCPSGYSGGDIRLIVGPTGLTVQWINRNLTKETVCLKENDTVSLIRIVGEKLEVCKNGTFGPVELLPFHFKGFRYKQST